MTSWWKAPSRLLARLVLLWVLIVAAGPSAPRLGSTPVQPETPIVVGAWLPHWRQGPALASFQANAELVSEASPFWYETGPGFGHGPPRIRPYPGAGDAAVIAAIRRAAVPLVPTLTNFALSKRALTKLLTSPAARRAHAADIARLVVSAGYDGIDLDYEHLPVTAREGYSAFVSELGRRLHEAGRLLVISVPPKTSELGRQRWVRAWDYRAIGRVADRVRIMAYNLHGDDTGPGPMAPLPWVDRVARFAATQIDPVKVQLGIPLFGYDWPESSGIPRSLTYTRSHALADRTKARRRWSPEDAMPWFTYSEGGVRHTVWYADANVVRTRLVIARWHRLAGVALWPIGEEDPAVWAEIRAAMDLRSRRQGAERPQ